MMPPEDGGGIDTMRSPRYSNSIGARHFAW